MTRLRRDTPYRLLVELIPESGFGDHYLKLAASLVVTTPSGQVVYPGSYELEDYWRHDAFTHFQVAGQRDQTTSAGDFYLARAVFDHTGAVDQRQAESMASVLKSVNRYADSQAQRFGQPDTAARFLAYVADYFTGAAAPFLRRDGGEYLPMTPDQLSWWLRREVSDWDEKWRTQ